MKAEAYAGGFAAPVFESQASFRALLEAMARPGLIRRLAAAAPPAPLAPGAGAALLTLCDPETPLWLDAPLRAAEAVRGWIGVQTGAPLVEAPQEARFAVIADPAKAPPFADFAQGTQEHPDRSATLILQLPALKSGPRLKLEGPGIEAAAFLAPQGLPPDFLARWAANRALFPRGLDLILTAPEALACLPRTTRVSQAEA